jgi:hypothetical protein
MNFIKISLLAIASVIFLSGCIKVDTKLKVNKDGSGTIEEQVLISDAIAQMMSEFMSSFQDSANVPESFNLFKEEELKEKASEYGDGVEYVSGKEIKKDGWQGYKAVYSIADINKIKMETDPNKKVEMGDSESGEFFNFKFVPGSVAQLIIDRPEYQMEFNEGEKETEEEAGDKKLDDKFIKMMEGMKVKIALEFNGNIQETNATYVDGSKVTLLDIDFDKLLSNKESLAKFKNNPPNNLDEMEEIVKNIAGMKIELKKPVKVKFD